MHSHSHGAVTDGRVIRWPRFYDLLMTVVSLGREGRIRQQVLDAAGLAPGLRVLDVGCGTGTLAIAAAKAVGPTGSASGIDPAAEMVDRARAKSSRAGLQVDFRVEAIEALSVPDKNVDVVFSTLMLHHLPGDLPARGLAEIRRVLAPGGHLVLVDFGGAANAKGLLRNAGFASIEELPIRPRALFMLVATVGDVDSSVAANRGETPPDAAR